MIFKIIMILVSFLLTLLIFGVYAFVVFTVKYKITSQRTWKQVAEDFGRYNDVKNRSKSK